jgi:hypothetical protein
VGLEQPVDPEPVVEHVHDRQPAKQPRLELKVGDIHQHILPARVGT